MNARYWMISGGIILLVVVAGALVWAQSRQTYNQGKQSTTGANVISPTSSTIASSQQEIELSVSQPTDGTTVTSSQLLVSGKTKPNAEVFINDKDTSADANGNFSTTLTLDEGENLIIVTANDADGKIAEKEFTVTYKVEG